MATVSILLATYQGERFISEQLESIRNQTHQDWNLYISDDGSKDKTIELASDFSRSLVNPVQIIRGPGEGFLRNFMHLLAKVPLDSDYYAFCDQDDSWHVNKLERALRWLDLQDPETANLYCSRTRYVDEAGNEIGLSPLFKREPCFANALVQSIAGGNTMVFNRKTLLLIRESGTHHNLPSHDWWLYIVTTGAGGKVKYDPTPTINYRQHDQNLVGANSTVQARIKRLKMLRSGRFQQWNKQHVEALDASLGILTPDNRKIYRLFKAMRDRPFPFNLQHMLAGRFHRQTLTGDIGLLVGVLLRKA